MKRNKIIAMMLALCLCVSISATSLPRTAAAATYGYDSVTKVYTVDPATPLDSAHVATINGALHDGDTLSFEAGQTYTLLYNGNTSTAEQGIKGSTLGNWCISKNITVTGDIGDTGNPATIKWGGSNGSYAYMFYVGTEYGCTSAAVKAGAPFSVTFKNLILDGGASNPSSTAANGRPRAGIDFVMATSAPTYIVPTDHQVINCQILNTYNTTYCPIIVNGTKVTVDGLTTNAGAAAINMGIGSQTYQAAYPPQLVLTGKGIVDTANKAYILADSAIHDGQFVIDNSGVTAGLSGLLGRTGTSTAAKNYYPLPTLNLSATPSAIDITGTTLTSVNFTALPMARAAATWPTTWPTRNVNVVIKANDASGEVLCTGSLRSNQTILASAAQSFSGTYNLGTYNGAPIDYTNHPDSLYVEIVDGETPLPEVVNGDTTNSDSFIGYVYASTSVPLMVTNPAVSFNANEGTGSMADKTAADDGSCVLPANTFTRDGYTFDGWATTPDGSVVYDNEGTVPLVPVAGLTLYAKWTADPQPIVFMPNGGTGTMTDGAAPTDSDYDLPANEFTRDGYAFNGWNTESGGSGVSYAATGTISPVPVGGVKLYAQWDPESQPIHFEGNGGTGDMGDAADNTGDSFTVPDSGYTRPGYQFVGWKDAEGNVYKVGDEVTEVPAGGITFIAQWEALSQPITFNANGGTGSMDDGHADTDSTYGLPAEEFSRPGYTFMGWNTEQDGSGIAYADLGDITAVPAGGVALFAQWRADPQPITFDANGGTGTMLDDSAATGSSYTVPENGFTWDGYQFTGWKDDNGTSYAPGDVIKDVPVGGVVLHAQWTPVKPGGDNTEGESSSKKHTSIVPPALEKSITGLPLTGDSSMMWQLVISLILLVGASAAAVVLRKKKSAKA